MFLLTNGCGLSSHAILEFIDDGDNSTAVIYEELNVYWVIYNRN